MAGYDFERPFIDQAAMGSFAARDPVVARRYGRVVRATRLTNVEYKIRFGRFGQANNMRNPPSCGRIFDGYLVVRRLGQFDQYETWMPDQVFEEIYDGRAKLPTR